MTLKYFKYLLFSSRLIRYYKLLRESDERTVFFQKHYPLLSKKELRNLVRKSRKAWLKYEMGCADFYRLRCEDKSMREISEYVSVRESSRFCWLVSSVKARELLNNKFDCYKHFSNYYGRRVEMISSGDIESGKGEAKLDKFFRNNLEQPCIVKPLKLNCGQGIKIMNSKSEIVNYLLLLGGGIIEELIIQDEALAAFNQSSVNTLRIHTANYGSEDIEVLWPCLRIGRAGSVVDNAGAGGVFCAIDVTTGTTIAAMDESRNVWKVHPDSKRDLVGYAIPRWQEAKALAKELAMKIPNAGFVAWDLALTKNGWVMVEGNSMPLIIYQIAVQKGIRKEFREMKSKYHHLTKYCD